MNFMPSKLIFILSALVCIPSFANDAKDPVFTVGSTSITVEAFNSVYTSKETELQKSEYKKFIEDLYMRKLRTIAQKEAVKKCEDMGGTVWNQFLVFYPNLDVSTGIYTMTAIASCDTHSTLLNKHFDMYDDQAEAGDTR